ncbi:MAG: acyl-CoA dehydrogenase, partial [Deltaproteobacteria bacterium]
MRPSQAWKKPAVFGRALNRRAGLDFTLGKEHKQIKKTIKDFVKGEFKRDVIHDLLNTGAYPEKIWKKAGELGFLGIHFPEAYSGEGLGMFEKVLIAEGLASGDSSVGACMGLADFGTEMLLLHGDEKLKQTFLPKIADGQILSASAPMESFTESNIKNSETRAIKRNDSWILNGSKRFVLNAGPLAGFYIVLCRTDPDATSPVKGFSTLLVEADRKGITTKGLGKRLG